MAVLMLGYSIVSYFVMAVASDVSNRPVSKWAWVCGLACPVLAWVCGRASADTGDGRDLVTISSSEYERIQAAAELYVFAEQRGLRLIRADGPNGHLVTHALVLDNLLLLPPGRHPRDVLRDVG
jgi:hypothetical protein